MVSLLLGAYPTPGTAIRRTGDADAGISTEVAASGNIHDALIEAGYVAESGNRYKKPIGNFHLVIDLLVPADSSRFASKTVGDRAFDSAPGLWLLLQVEPLLIDVGVTLLDGTVLEFTTKTPTVEGAIILKSMAAHTRNEMRDVEDIYNLLLILQHHGAEAVGPWRLNQPNLKGSRLDAARALHNLADMAASKRLGEGTDIRPEIMAALIRRYVTRP